MILLFIVPIIVIFLIIAYFGGFKNIKVTNDVQGGETVVYHEIKGDYKQSSHAMDKIYYTLLKEHNINTFKGVGIYYDNPKLVEKEKLRSDAGCIIENKDTLKIHSLPKNLLVKTLPTKEYMVSSFPFKGKLSILFSIMKVYPALQKYALNKGFDDRGAVIEIYDVPNKLILYRKEIT